MIDQTMTLFATAIQCPKCGARSDVTVMNIGDRPVPILSAIGFKTHYCPGGQEPTSEDLNPIGEILGEALSGMGKPMHLGKRSVNICAGISEEHLHKTCQECGFEFLMQTADTSLRQLGKLIGDAQAEKQKGGGV